MVTCDDCYSDDCEGQCNDLPSCPSCGGPAQLLGILGARAHYRCHDCGQDFSQVA